MCCCRQESGADSVPQATRGLRSVPISTLAPWDLNVLHSWQSHLPQLARARSRHGDERLWNFGEPEENHCIERPLKRSETKEPNATTCKWWQLCLMAPSSQDSGANAAMSADPAVWITDWASDSVRHVVSVICVARFVPPISEHLSRLRGRGVLSAD